MPDSCNCCEGSEGCPHGQWITLDRWKGSKIIPNNLRDLQLNGESIWEMLDLDKYENSNWQWRIVVLGTGNIPDATTLCLAQNRRDWREWVTPVSEQLSTVLFKLELGNIRWPDSPLAIHGDLIGGDFTLTLRAFSWSETTAVLPWNATAIDVQNALQALPNAARAGTIQVTGGPLAHDKFMTVACIAPLNFMSLTATTNFEGTPPTVDVRTTQGGGPTANETQILSPSWPADGGSFRIQLTAQGTTQTTSAIIHDGDTTLVQSKLNALINCNDPPSGNAAVITDFVGDQVRRYHVTFLNALALTNIAPLVGISSLTNTPSLVITTPLNSDVYEFRNEYEPLNVGTIWNGYIRSAYGNAGPAYQDNDIDYGNRDLRSSLLTYVENTTTLPGAVQVDRLPCGYGEVLGCATLAGIPHVGRKNDAPQSNAAYAQFIASNGTIQVVSPKGFELAIQIRCLSCHYSSEFNLWGMYEDSRHKYAKVFDRADRQVYDPPEGFSCASQDPEYGVCRQWWLQTSNVPYIIKKKFGPDGYDGHLINKKFFADGATKTRDTVCKPGVVLLGDGYYKAKNQSIKHAHWSCDANGLRLKVCGDKHKRKPLEENVELHPTSNITRLKEIYGTEFSYWGGWIDVEHSVTGHLNDDSTIWTIEYNKIRCTINDYDLTNVDVLFLGGFPAGSCPQSPTMPETGTEEQLDYYYWLTVLPALDKEFEEGTLNELKRWLDLGGKTLVLDGGAFPQKFLSELGLSTTVERTAVYGSGPEVYAGLVTIADPTPTPNTLNGSNWFNTIFGAELPIYTDPVHYTPAFPALYVEPMPHPFTNDVASGIRDDGTPLIVQDFTMEMSNVAGEPQISQHVNRGLINISQKHQYLNHFFDTFNYPTGGLRPYTTAIPLVVPGTNAIVLGRVRGKLPIAPWFADGNYVTTDVDYPGIVVEHWNCNFKLKFTDGITVQETALLPFNVTANEIRLALEALPLIGPTMTVIGGPLPGSVDIHFDSTLLQGTDVALLEVVGPATKYLKIEVVQEGGLVAGSSVDEIQRISGVVGPSRVVISQVNELVEPDAWGTNWRLLRQLDGDSKINGAYSQAGVGSTPELLLPRDFPPGCHSYPYEGYCKDGYQWGLGLSHVASAQFLRNLWERRRDY